MLDRPRLHLIEHVDTGVDATVTTKRCHGYKTGQQIVITIPKEYGYELRKVTTIKVVDGKSFKTDIDTSQLPLFFAWRPTYYKAYTPAQCMPNIYEE